MFLPTKSKFAFDCSCKSLPVSSHGNLYLWTFTFAEVIDVAEGRRRWSEFLRALRKERKNRGQAKLKGLRVFELHPGGHGLHIHVATGCFMHVNQVRRLWFSVGGGRIHVKPIAPQRASDLSKYLRKQGRPECFKGARMWAAFGGADHTRVKDITIESNWTRTYAALCASLGFFSKLPWFQRCTAVANVERDLPWNFGFCDRWGDPVLAAGAAMRPRQPF